MSAKEGLQPYPASVSSKVDFIGHSWSKGGTIWRHSRNVRPDEIQQDSDPLYEAVWFVSRHRPVGAAEIIRILAASPDERHRMAATLMINNVMFESAPAICMEVGRSLAEDDLATVREAAVAAMALTFRADACKGEF
jgi:hypothetical protein